MKSLILQVCHSILRPLASLLLHCGMTWREFSELSKISFIEVAASEFGKRGRPTSTSRVCILTGIHRKEVKRIRDLLADQPHNEIKVTKSSDATRMLSGWHLDQEFLNSKGQPLPLPLEQGEPSFSDLFRKYGGDTPQQTMLRELKDGNAIEISPEGIVTVLSRYFMPQALSEENIEMFGDHLSLHAQTLKNNVVDHATTAPRFEGSALNAPLTQVI